jgi:amino acid adenylation domain-containing protein
MLHSVLTHAASHGYADRVAVVDAASRASIDYRALDALSDALRDRLGHIGVGRGDRVGIYARKSIDTVAAIFGILKAGGAYVPVDPSAPPARNAFIHSDCAVAAMILERRFEAAYRAEFDALNRPLPVLIVLDDAGDGDGLRNALRGLQARDPAPQVTTADGDDEALAYILYTSGSTGTPKGVMLSHRNASAFVAWSAQTFAPQPDDVFSSHAPLHFDLSVFDLFVSLRHGASVVLIGEAAGRDPSALAELIEDFGITVWYSAPSILTLLARSGGLGDRDLRRLRLILFAGEVFPVVHLRALKAQLRGPRYFNLYGPTETNVCTYYEIPDSVPEDRVDPYPIGAVCENLEAAVVDADGRNVSAGLEGELCIAGPNVMLGYWGKPEETRKRFVAIGAEPRARWYRTGDLVVEEAGGNYRYVGRLDRMIKKRGYRVELGEIEACLYRHEAVAEVAVVALPDDLRGVRVEAHIGLGGRHKPSIIALKGFCAKYLPVYMIPDAFVFHEQLPRTSTDKVDYQSLQARA